MARNDTATLAAVGEEAFFSAAETVGHVRDSLAFHALAAALGSFVVLIIAGCLVVRYFGFDAHVRKLADKNYEEGIAERDDDQAFRAGLTAGASLLMGAMDDGEMDEHESRQVFRAFDDDHSGSLDFTELRKVVISIFRVARDGKLERATSQAETNNIKDGFKSILSHLQSDAGREQLRQTFDPTGDGSISEGEFIQAFPKFSETLSGSMSTLATTEELKRFMKAATSPSEATPPSGSESPLKISEMAALHRVVSQHKWRVASASGGGVAASVESRGRGRGSSSSSSSLHKGSSNIFAAQMGDRLPPLEVVVDVGGAGAAAGSAAARRP